MTSAESGRNSQLTHQGSYPFAGDLARQLMPMKTEG
jgi:hypothetical protein